MKRMSTLLLATILLAAPLGARKKMEPNPALASIHKIFIKGNSQAADKARAKLLEGKTCFSLAEKAETADAVLEIADSATGDPGIFGTMGARHNVVSGTLTLKTGELVWSDSARFSDAPFMSGDKVAADILVSGLVKDAGCKQRRR